MSNKYFDAEQKAEALLQALGEELGESRARYAASLMEEHPDASPRPKANRSRSRRVLILAAVLILVMALAIVIADGVKLKKNHVAMEETPNESTRIIDESKQELDPADFVVGYVPEGYELESDEMLGEDIREITYVDENEDYVHIFIAKTNKYTSNVDNERLKKEEIIVNDRQAVLVSRGGYCYLIWQMGDCTVDLSTVLSKEDTKTIGQHIGHE